MKTSIALLLTTSTLLAQAPPVVTNVEWVTFLVSNACGFYYLPLTNISTNGVTTCPLCQWDGGCEQFGLNLGSACPMKYVEFHWNLYGERTAYTTNFITTANAYRWCPYYPFPVGHPQDLVTIVWTDSYTNKPWPPPTNNSSTGDTIYGWKRIEDIDYTDVIESWSTNYLFFTNPAETRFDREFFTASRLSTNTPVMYTTNVIFPH